MKSLLVLAATLLATQSVFASVTNYKCQSIKYYDLSSSVAKVSADTSNSFQMSAERVRERNGESIFITTDHSGPQLIDTFPLLTSRKLGSVGISPLVANIVGNKQVLMNQSILLSGATAMMETSCFLNRSTPCRGFSYYIYWAYYSDSTPQGELLEFICK